MISIAPSLTNAGKSLIIRGMDGETITFTRFKVGDGELEGRDPASLDDLINTLVTFSIDSTDTSNEGFIELTGHFDNSGLTGDFRWRELGIFAEGEDEVEHLYAYANDGDNAGTIRKAQTDVIVEQTVTLIVAIGSAENVEAIVTPSALYAAKEDFDAHVADVSNPHSVTKAQVGLGNVPNVTTNNQTPTWSASNTYNDMASGQTLSAILARAQKAATTLYSHVNSTGNPHMMTPAQIGAAPARHEHSGYDITSDEVRVERGGTGANNAADARANLGACAIFDYTASVPTTGWTGSSAPYTLQLTVTGIKETDRPFAEAAQTGTWETDVAIREAWNCITQITTEADAITLTAEDIPATAFTLRLRCFR